MVRRREIDVARAFVSLSNLPGFIPISLCLKLDWPSAGVSAPLRKRPDEAHPTSHYAWEDKSPCSMREDLHHALRVCFPGLSMQRCACPNWCSPGERCGWFPGTTGLEGKERAFPSSKKRCQGLPDLPGRSRGRARKPGWGDLPAISSPVTKQTPVLPCSPQRAQARWTLAFHADACGQRLPGARASNRSSSSLC